MPDWEAQLRLDSAANQPWLEYERSRPGFACRANYLDLTSLIPLLICLAFGWVDWVLVFVSKLGIGWSRWWRRGSFLAWCGGVGRELGVGCGGVWLRLLGGGVKGVLREEGVLSSDR